MSSNQKGGRYGKLKLPVCHAIAVKVYLIATLINRYCLAMLHVAIYFSLILFGFSLLLFQLKFDYRIANVNNVNSHRNNSGIRTILHIITTWQTNNVQI